VVADADNVLKTPGFRTTDKNNSTVSIVEYSVRSSDITLGNRTLDYDAKLLFATGPLGLAFASYVAEPFTSITNGSHVWAGVQMRNEIGSNVVNVPGFAQRDKPTSNFRIVADLTSGTGFTYETTGSSPVFELAGTGQVDKATGLLSASNLTFDAQPASQTDGETSGVVLRGQIAGKGQAVVGLFTHEGAYGNALAGESGNGISGGFVGTQSSLKTRSVFEGTFTPHSAGSDAGIITSIASVDGFQRSTRVDEFGRTTVIPGTGVKILGLGADDVKTRAELESNQAAINAGTSDTLLTSVRTLGLVTRWRSSYQESILSSNDINGEDGGLKLFASTNPNVATAFIVAGNPGQGVFSAPATGAYTFITNVFGVSGAMMGEKSRFKVDFATQRINITGALSATNKTFDRTTGDFDLTGVTYGASSDYMLQGVFHSGGGTAPAGVSGVYRNATGRGAFSGTGIARAAILSDGFAAATDSELLGRIK